jgi:hypothetical protein
MKVGASKLRALSEKSTSVQKHVEKLKFYGRLPEAIRRDITDLK